MSNSRSLALSLSHAFCSLSTTPLSTLSLSFSTYHPLSLSHTPSATLTLSNMSTNTLEQLVYLVS